VLHNLNHRKNLHKLRQMAAQIALRQRWRQGRESPWTEKEMLRPPVPADCH